MESYRRFRFDEMKERQEQRGAETPTENTNELDQLQDTEGRLTGPTGPTGPTTVQRRPCVRRTGVVIISPAAVLFAVWTAAPFPSRFSYTDARSNLADHRHHKIIQPLSHSPPAPPAGRTRARQRADSSDDLTTDSLA